MSYNSPSPHTVDVAATESVTPLSPSMDRPLDARAVISQSLGVDIFMAFVALLVGVVLASAVGAVNVTDAVDATEVLPPRWLILGACLLPVVLWLFIDVLSAASNPAVLPFARSKNGMKAVYAKRIHLLLLAFYFTAILVALCWSALSMLLFSKIFVSAVFAIALYALGQSIPSRRMSFLVSGVLFLVVLVATQAFIVLRLEADSERANQEVLDDFNDVGQDDNDVDEQFFEERGE